MLKSCSGRTEVRGLDVTVPRHSVKSRPGEPVVLKGASCPRRFSLVDASFLLEPAVGVLSSAEMESHDTVLCGKKFLNATRLLNTFELLIEMPRSIKENSPVLILLQLRDRDNSLLCPRYLSGHRFYVSTTVSSGPALSRGRSRTAGRREL